MLDCFHDLCFLSFMFRCQASYTGELCDSVIPITTDTPNTTTTAPGGNLV